MSSMTRRPKVVVTNWVHDAVLDYLAQRFSVEANREREPWPDWALRSRAADAEAMMAFMPDRVDAAFLDGCPDLMIVAGALKGSTISTRRPAPRAACGSPWCRTC